MYRGVHIREQAGPLTSGKNAGHSGRYLSQAMTHNVQLHVGELAARLSRVRGPGRENADRVEDVGRVVTFMENRCHARQTETARKILPLDPDSSLNELNGSLLVSLVRARFLAATSFPSLFFFSFFFFA